VLLIEMPEPEVGKCYRWTSNKQGLGKFLGKKVLLSL
jgi:hypothetical protein